MAKFEKNVCNCFFLVVHNAQNFSPAIPQGIYLEHFMSTKYLSNKHENKRYKIMIDM